MGMYLYFKTREPVKPAVRRAIERDAERAIRNQSWDAFGPIFLDPPGKDGRLTGSSKLNHLPAPEERAHFPSPDSDDNNIRLLLRLLCRWSEKYRLTWKLDFEGEPLGMIVHGECEPGLKTRIDGLASIGEILEELAGSTEYPAPLANAAQDAGDGEREITGPNEDETPPTLRIWREPD